MKIERFEDIIAWQKARSVAIAVYRDFNECRDFGFRDQIQRATVSIMNNIAEGFERGTNPEMKRFLFIAKGSCGEARSMCYLADQLKYLSNDDAQKYCQQFIEISKIISGLIKTL